MGWRVRGEAAAVVAHREAVGLAEEPLGVVGVGKAAGGGDCADLHLRRPQLGAYGLQPGAREGVGERPAAVLPEPLADEGPRDAEVRDHVTGADAVRRLPLNEVNRPLDQMRGWCNGCRAFALDDLGVLQLDDLPSRVYVGHQPVERHCGDLALADLAGGETCKRRTREVAEDRVVVHADHLHVFGDREARAVARLKHLYAALVVGGHDCDRLRHGRQRILQIGEVVGRTRHVRRFD